LQVEGAFPLQIKIIYVSIYLLKLLNLVNFKFGEIVLEMQWSE